MYPKTYLDKLKSIAQSYFSEIEICVWRNLSVYLANNFAQHVFIKHIYGNAIIYNITMVDT